MAVKMQWIFSFILLLAWNNHVLGQDSEEKKKKDVSFAFYDGTMIAGYVDKGAFLNFMGPNVNFNKGASRIVIGMLPSLRFKKDKSVTTKNSFITPNLGVGVTYSYKSFALQIPCYYNSKTSTSNGYWAVGVGIGYRFKNKKKQDGKV